MKYEIKKVIKNNKTLSAIKITTICLYILSSVILLASVGFFLLTYIPYVSNPEFEKGIIFIIGIVFSYVGSIGGLLLMLVSIGINIFYLQRKNKLIKQIKFTYENLEDAHE